MVSISLLHAEAIGICALILIILFFLNIKYWRPYIINSLSLIYIFDILGCACDLIWGFIDGIPQYTVLNHICDIVSLSCPSIVGLCYLCHVNEQTGGTLFSTPLKAAAWCILPAFSITMVISSPITGIAYSLTDACYTRGSHYFVVYLAAYGYAVLGCVMSLLRLRRTEVYVERRKLFALGIFVLPGLLLAAFQSIVLPVGISTIHVGILISLLILFASSQNEQITRDALTKLPNWFSIDRALLDAVRTQRGGSDKQLWLMFGDLDKFKLINDSFGHTTGNAALQMAADVIYRVSRKYNAVAGRLGGDEFVIIVEAESENTVSAITQELPDALDEASRDAEFSLKMSFGVTLYREGMNAKQLLDAADQKLYEAKAQKQLIRHA